MAMTRHEVAAKAEELRLKVDRLRKMKVSIWNPQPMVDQIAELADDTLELIAALALREGDG